MSITEKEGFAVLEAMRRLDYFMLCIKVWIYTDHANLAYMYDPYEHNPGMYRHTANRLMRRALKLCNFLYLIEFIPGLKNVWADILARWAVKTDTK